MKTETVVENGFKETEIGLMPKSWQVRTVKNTCEKPQYGYTESASDKPIGPKFLRITDITDKGVDWLKVPYCKCPQELINKYKLEKGDILFARIGATTGKSFIVEKCPFAVYASYLIRLRTKTELNPMYLYYFFNSEMYWKQIDAHKGSSLKKGVNGSILASLIFPFPEKPEQQKIAFVLSKIQQAIEQQDRIIETTKELKKSVMNKLFREGLHGEEQKETEIGLMPKSWRIVKLGDNDIVKVIMGQSPPSSTYNTMKEGLPFFQGKAEFGDIYPKAKKYCSKPNRIANEGDILLSVRAPVGDVNLSPFICCIGRGLAAIRCKDKLNNYFLFNYLLQSKNKIASLGDGSTFKAIGKTVVKNIRFPLPERKEQDEITNIFSNTDKKISQAKSKKQTFRALFRTMLNQLMTGKVRVKDFDFEVN